ncbi:MAG: transposase [Elusimicrobia bacterium]|nr:transposase [Elusimicrobiota bacterium]
MPLSNLQWTQLARNLPPPKREPKLKHLRKGGRPRHDDRLCFEALLWLLAHGASWRRLPQDFGHRSTLHERISQWAFSGLLARLWIHYLSQQSPNEIAFWKKCLRSRPKGHAFAVLETVTRIVL